MLRVDEAQQRILDRVHPVGAERVAVRAAAGRTCREDVVAPFPVPPRDNSAMDGWALRHVDGGGVLRCVLVVPAGGLGGRIGPGECARIFTGAPLPEGADTVVAQELAHAVGDGVGAEVRFPRLGPPGDNVRRAGEDIGVGSVVVPSGTRLREAHLGLLGSIGRTFVDVARKPRVAVLATGDEVHEPGETLPTGHIYSGNSGALLAQIEAAGGEATYLGIAGDSAAALDRALDSLDRADVLLTIGGVSVGDYDFVKQAIAARGGEQEFWKVALRPGKPNAFGRLGETSFFGLPGNPVSAMVGFWLFVWPALRAMQGDPRPQLRTRIATLTEPLRKRAGLRVMLRGVLAWDDAGGYTVRTTGPQGSGVLTSVAAANVLIEFPEAAESLDPGERVRVLMIPGAEQP